MTRRLTCALLAILMLLAALLPAAAELTMTEVELTEDEPEAEEETAELTPREDFIERIISYGKMLYDKAGGRPQRAHYKSDHYVCKNFTTYIFNQTRGDFRMAEYPDVKLVIPDNATAKQCKPYAYGYRWKNVSAEKGNPFVVAAQFVYNTDLSEEENMELALEFMRQAKRGDFFQLTGYYGGGVGAHSAIIIGDYDPETDKVYWMDSNMKGTRIDGIRYGYVQFNADATIQWWASTFCRKTRGATLYRLRDDIIYKPE